MAQGRFRRLLLQMRIATLVVALFGMGYGFSAIAQGNSSGEQMAVNTSQISGLEKVVADHQDKIEKLEVTVAVVKSDAEENNKILWSLLTGTVMLVIERLMGIINGRRKERASPEE